MRSALIRWAPAVSLIPSMRPSTCSGTPDSSWPGTRPIRVGQFLRTRSWLPPMPPLATMTAWARNSKSRRAVREDATPRAADVGSSTAPRTVVTAAFRPADERERLQPALAEPAALLARREVHVGVGPLPGPVVLGTVEAGGAQPVLQREFVAVVDAQPALFGAVDEE